MVLVPTFCIIYFLSQPTAGHVDQPVDVHDEEIFPAPAKVPFPSPEVVQFWEELLDGILKNGPTTPQIVSNPRATRSHFDPKLQVPNGHAYQSPDLLRLKDEERDSMKKSHDGYVLKVKDIAAKLPFERGSRGVVMTAGESHLGIAVTSLLMLRQTGCSLPVQLFLNDPNDRTRRVCEAVLGNIDVECISFQSIFSTTRMMPGISMFQFKVFSLLFSSFQKLLFLDADAFPIHDPEGLFDREPFTSHGLVTWPDFWLPTVSPVFYNITGTPSPALNNNSRSSESGILMYDKAKHADSLLLATYYNFYGPRHYYPLLSQGADGEGDKETFLQSAFVMGKSAYAVQTQVGAVGRRYDGIPRSSALKQADPNHDWLLTEARRKRSWFSMLNWSGGVKEKVRARCLFIHHNQVKIDVRHMGATLATVLRKDERGQYTRLWGKQKGLIRSAGYDVERAMWKEDLRITCRAHLVEECKKLREFFIKVFIDGV